MIHPTDPLAYAKRYCADRASPEGIAGIIGQGLLITDCRGNLDRVKAEQSTH